MNLGINNNVNNYKQNFTASRLPSKKQIQACEYLSDEAKKAFIEMRPNIRNLSRKADIEMNLSDRFLDVYVGKIGKKPWQTSDNSIGQWVHPYEPIKWGRTSYDLATQDGDYIVNNLHCDTILAVDAYSKRLQNAGK